jgi:hypothetical protein
MKTMAIMGKSFYNKNKIGDMAGSILDFLAILLQLFS